MSSALDPVVSNLFFTMSLIPKLGRPRKTQSTFLLPQAKLPSVSVLITFCKENREDIDMTTNSLIDQTYPKDKYDSPDEFAEPITRKR